MQDMMTQNANTKPNTDSLLGLPYKALQAVPVQECGEAMVAVNKLYPKIACVAQNHEATAFTAGDMMLRSGVAERLNLVNEALQRERPDASIKLVYAYRHPSIQQRYFEEISRGIRLKNPGLDEEAIKDRTHALIAVPEVAGHPTGGAVDVTIEERGAELDMGTPIWSLNLPALVPVFAPGITEEQRENRLLLRRVMKEQDFAPFDGEWWHFSHGDREWAALSAAPLAKYQQIDIQNGAADLDQPKLPPREDFLSE